MIRGRFFIVGTPRSGTTLLQSLVATQAEVASFPETHFFGLPGIRRRDFWLLRVGIAPVAMRRRMIQQLSRLLDAADRPDLKPLLPTEGPMVRGYTRAFVDLLDRLSITQGKALWLEKTPSHLYFVDLIERYVPNARFIHLSRSAPDVVASLYQVTNDHPELWGGAYDIDQCIDRWFLDRQLSSRHLQKNHHLAVTYEDLVTHTEDTLAGVGDFMGFRFDPVLLGQHRAVADRLILNFESWKDAAREEISNSNRKKFERVFSREQKDYILHRIGKLVN